jgi:hypothetical protein
MNTSNTDLQVTIHVPVDVEEPERERFESALVAFIFGRDHIRSELAEPLAARGVDVRQVARLAAQQPLGVCPTANALEFVPTERVAQVAAEHGVDLTAGGRVFVVFDYDAYADGKAPDDQLQIELGLRGGIGEALDDPEEFTADVVRALFGDCQLSVAAQDYLRAHGVDLVEIAAEHRDKLEDGRIPATTRVSPQVAAILNARGFETDRFGRFAVKTIRDVETIEPQGSDLAWSKTTCC